MSEGNDDIHWAPAGVAPPQGTTAGQRAEPEQPPADTPDAGPATAATEPALPPGWKALADWLKAPPPPNLGDAHTGHFFLITPDVFVYGGQMFYQPPRQPFGYFSYHIFKGSATLIPNVQWGEM